MNTSQSRACLCSIAALFMLLPGYASGSEHTGYWRIESTLQGEEFRCQGVSSKNQLISTLRKAGWIDDGIPPINWERDEVVVVSSSRHSNQGQMFFYGLNKTPDAITLDYGWRKYTADVIARSFGLTDTERSTIIVVAYRRGLDNGIHFKYRNQGMR